MSTKINKGQTPTSSSKDETFIQLNEYKNKYVSAYLSEMMHYNYKIDKSVDHVSEFQDPFIADKFIEKENLIKSLFPSIDTNFLNINVPFDKLRNRIKEYEGYTESVVLNTWKNIENVSAQLIEVQDDLVILECLIDKENKIYEEREFRKSLFEGYDLSQGNLFYLRVFDRPNETKLEIHEDPKRSRASDFPKRNFSKLFSDSVLFKKKQ